MDALNMLYVATTRSKEYLYINTQGKKTKTITNIGDLLNMVYEDKLSEDGQYVIEGEVSDQSEKGSAVQEIEMESYPVSDRLSQVFDANLKRREIDLITGESAGRTGTILHEVLAMASSAEEVDDALRTLLLDGIFKAEEFPFLKAQALAVLQHTGLQEILGKSKQSLNERSIIDTKGKSYRPDKVLVNGNELIIIDYKFTQQESDKHIEQVAHYKALLMAMGYTDVKTYLFYAVSGQLKLV